MQVPADLRYTKTHEWVRWEGGTATVGITAFAQAQLGELTYVELPAVGRHAETGKEIAVVESVKAAADVYAPVSGVVTETNAALNDDPGLVNRDPYGAGWLFKLRADRPAEVEALLDAASYEALLAEKKS